METDRFYIKATTDRALDQKSRISTAGNSPHHVLQLSGDESLRSWRMLGINGCCWGNWQGCKGRFMDHLVIKSNAQFEQTEPDVIFPARSPCWVTTGNVRKTSSKWLQTLQRVWKWNMCWLQPRGVDGPIRCSLTSTGWSSGEGHRGQGLFKVRPSLTS